jgi:S-disulfanyl-L-cysteine oxidoreductase SoxD
MSMSRRAIRSPAAALLVLFAAPGLAQQGPGLGVEATADQIAAWALTVQPDGQGLPAGSGTARAGQPIYAEKCAGCHGDDGRGGPNDQLAGGQGTLASANPVRTIGSYWPYATTVFDYIRRAMPFPAPQSLTDEEAYALTAYLLYLNQIVPIDKVIDAKSLPAIEMPNAKNFYSAYKPSD